MLWVANFGSPVLFIYVQLTSKYSNPYISFLTHFDMKSIINNARKNWQLPWSWISDIHTLRLVCGVVISKGPIIGGRHGSLRSCLGYILFLEFFKFRASGVYYYGPHVIAFSCMGFLRGLMGLFPVFCTQLWTLNTSEEHMGGVQNFLLFFQKILAKGLVGGAFFSLSSASSLFC